MIKNTELVINFKFRDDSQLLCVGNPTKIYRFYVRN